MHKELFKAKNSKEYEISFSTFGEEITIKSGKEIVGRILLEQRLASSPQDSDYYHIINLSLNESICRKGIGTFCLETHKSIFGLPLTAGADDGCKRDDGSHLTGAGLPFIEKMRALDIVESLSQDFISY